MTSFLKTLTACCCPTDDKEKENQEQESDQENGLLRKNRKQFIESGETGMTFGQKSSLASLPSLHEEREGDDEEQFQGRPTVASDFHLLINEDQTIDTSQTYIIN